MKNVNTTSKTTVLMIGAALAIRTTLMHGFFFLFLFCCCLLGLSMLDMSSGKIRLPNHILVLIPW